MGTYCSCLKGPDLTLNDIPQTQTPRMQSVRSKQKYQEQYHQDNEIPQPHISQFQIPLQSVARAFLIRQSLIPQFKQYKKYNRKKNKQKKKQKKIQSDRQIDLNTFYKKNLQTLALSMTEKFTNYTLANNLGDVLPKTLSRINKELSSLSKSLPCEADGSIFIVANSSNLSELRALIQGSSDTPYQHGLFLFDIKLPINYPVSPPTVNLATTGGHSVRFNPNLYANGKVCLSVLNTWEGSPEQMWIPNYSTLLQVLISIQSLVMNSDIIQKQPGFQYYLRESDENVAYRMVVRHANMEFAIADMIENPPVEFADVVRRHFSIKKKKVLETLEKWVDQAGGVTNSVLQRDLQNNDYMSQIRSGGLRISFENSLNRIRDLLKRI